MSSSFSLGVVVLWLLLLLLLIFFLHFFFINSLKISCKCTISFDHIHPVSPPPTPLRLSSHPISILSPLLLSPIWAAHVLTGVRSPHCPWSSYQELHLKETLTLAASLGRVNSSSAGGGVKCGLACIGLQPATPAAGSSREPWSYRVQTFHQGPLISVSSICKLLLPRWSLGLAVRGMKQNLICGYTPQTPIFCPSTRCLTRGSVFTTYSEQRTLSDQVCFVVGSFFFYR